MPFFCIFLLGHLFALTYQITQTFSVFEPVPVLHKYDLPFEPSSQMFQAKSKSVLRLRFPAYLSEIVRALLYQSFSLCLY